VNSFQETVEVVLIAIRKAENVWSKAKGAGPLWGVLDTTRWSA
jgi:hypothetical protein